MPTFKLNMFGTTHRNEIDSNAKTRFGTFLLFNLHILQVEYQDIVLSSFDMFIEYFAYPFNPISTFSLTVPSNVPTYANQRIGTTISAYVPSTTQSIGRRKSFKPRPQIIHLTATTPTSPIDLYTCGFGGSPNPLPATPLTTCLQPTVSSPCPNPEDFRLFSMSHYVALKFVDNFRCFDPDWTDMTSTQQINGLYIVNNGIYRLPIKVVIIANNCRFEHTGEINIYSDWYNNTAVFGTADCMFNPFIRPLGFNDKIIIS
jgi:hypothetical protein